MESFKKFPKGKLANRCEFFGSLKFIDECIGEKDYLHVINVCNAFKMNIMGDYHDHRHFVID